MFYVIIANNNEKSEIFDNIKDAKENLKKSDGRMKAFRTREDASDFLTSSYHQDADLSTLMEKLMMDESMDTSGQDSSMNDSVSSQADEEDSFPSPTPAMFSMLRKQIESGKYEQVETTIWSNPRILVTVCDSATYLMAGPKYNACHIAARANQAEILGLLLDTISNFSFLKKLYPKQPDENVQDRVNHLLDSYLNTVDPKQGNTPLHFACKKGYYKVVKVLLTFEGCDLKIKDSNGQTAEESICIQAEEATELGKQKIKDLFRVQPHSPLHRDQLKKRLLLTKRLSPSKAGDTN